MLYNHDNVEPSKLIHANDLYDLIQRSNGVDDTISTTHLLRCSPDIFRCKNNNFEQRFECITPTRVSQSPNKCCGSNNRISCLQETELQCKTTELSNTKFRDIQTLPRETCNDKPTSFNQMKFDDLRETRRFLHISRIISLG
ncbi:hypothetical protein GJ496_007854 [Pomphorhynchus laevis]|nr:hypothetical protein GJ496_007854 [Pomphorhynchus laevis]